MSSNSTPISYKAILENGNRLERAILQTLIYFDLFNYPLTSAEVLQFLQLRSSQIAVDETLNQLLHRKQVLKCGNLYSLQFHPDIFKRRLTGNSLADSLFPKIKRQADLIQRFPFVRAVMASGSFSKNFMDEKSDFDFFIICAPKRLWISRMLLVLYKRLFLKNSHKYFCVNYFVEDSHLEIAEQNIFTATELATVLPLTGLQWYPKLIAANQHWLANFFPNFKPRVVVAEKIVNSYSKRILEIIFTISGARFINKLFRRFTLITWKRKYSSQYSGSDFKIAFKTTDSVSKNHPKNYQQKVVERYQARVNAEFNKAEVI